MRWKEMTGDPDRKNTSPEILRARVRKCVRSLAGRILNGEIPKSQRLWSGAGVAVVFRLPRRPERIREWYADPRFVVTPHGLEVSRVFEELWKAFRPLLDSESKIAFFDRLANAVLSCSNESGEEDCTENPPFLKDLLLAILYEAVLFEKELEEGAFGSRMASSGNGIPDDRLRSSDRGTRQERLQFFERLPDPEDPAR